MFLEKILIDPQEEEKEIFKDRCSVPCRIRLDSGPTMGIGVTPSLARSLSHTLPTEGPPLRFIPRLLRFPSGTLPHET